MKVLCVGDTHGSETPLLIAKEKEPLVDKIVFLGDYLDSYDNSWSTQKEILEQIIEFKKQHMEKVVLLLGNHDIEYLKAFPQFSLTSGHQHKYHMIIKDFLEKNIELFQITYIKDFWIFSHAGISIDWLDDPTNEERKGNYIHRIGPWDIYDIDKAFFQKQYNVFEHNSDDPYGDNSSESCLWIRPGALLEKSYAMYNQVVGHTELVNPVEPNNNFWKLDNRIVKTKNDDKIVFIDSPTRNVYAIVDTGMNKVQVEEWFKN